MKIYQVEISNFRGIANAKVSFDERTILIGPNNCGKSTIVEALALTLGRDRMVRQLTEHDFHKSDPGPQSRIKIVVTLGDFPKGIPDQNPNWFGAGRAIPKWFHAETQDLKPEKATNEDSLCLQIGFCARFDESTLEVETIRYFHDSDSSDDPFDEDGVTRIPQNLIHQIGFFLVPSTRTWDRTLSFGSELFTRVISTLGKVPAEEILGARDTVRRKMGFESSGGFKTVVSNINQELSKLLPTNPKLTFRLTSTDSESLLRAMTPHFSFDGGSELPSTRHGSGLLSLQTLLLLLEFGKARLLKKENFILAIEEPELHLPPSMQKKVIFRADRASNQLICTSHSSRISSIFQPTEIRILEKVGDALKASPLLKSPLGHKTRNHSRKLFNDFRMQLVEGLLHPVVIITEGRIEYEFFDLLIRFTESSKRAFSDPESENTFSTFLGLIASEGSNICTTYEHIADLREKVCVLVDGDVAGNDYLDSLLKIGSPPLRIIQWRKDNSIEDIIGEILKQDSVFVLEFLNQEQHVKSVFSGSITTIDDLVLALKKETKEGGLKTNYLALEEICAAISESEKCSMFFTSLMEKVKSIALNGDIPDGFSRHGKSTGKSLVVAQT
jgi:putative ATP-dependent endonuclease of OLD family